MQGMAELREPEANVWGQLPKGAKTSYLTIHPPGKPISDPSDGHQLLSPDDGSHFMVIDVMPLRYELLQLDVEGHMRAAFLKEDDFSGQWLVP